MAELQMDPFVSTEPELKVDEQTLALLDERLADTTPLITVEAARARVKQRFTNFSTNQPR